MNQPLYDVEIEKVVAFIRQYEAKTVLLQLPDGLKHRAGEIVDLIGTAEPDVQCYLWLGNCYGACDVPLHLQHEVDLLVQFGHNQFKKNPRGWKA